MSWHIVVLPKNEGGYGFPIRTRMVNLSDAIDDVLRKLGLEGAEDGCYEITATYRP